MSIGQEILERILTTGTAFRVECPDSPSSPCIVVWSANVAEQMGQMILEHFRCENFTGEKMVRAKLKCEVVTDYGTQREVILRPVAGDSEANKDWSKYTPSGEIKLTITNPAAFNQFRPGVEYFATFDEVVGSAG